MNVASACRRKKHTLPGALFPRSPPRAPHARPNRRWQRAQMRFHGGTGCAARTAEKDRGSGGDGKAGVVQTWLAGDGGGLMRGACVAV